MTPKPPTIEESQIALLPVFLDMCENQQYNLGIRLNATKQEAEALKQQIIAEHEFYINCTKKYPNLANYTIGLLKNQRTDQDKLNEQIVEILKEFYFCKNCHHLARLDKPSTDSILRICVNCQKPYESLYDTIKSISETKS